MDNAYLRTLRPSLRMLLAALCMGAFVSCGMEDDLGLCPDAGNTAQPVIMHIEAQQTPAVRAEENAKTGENIHSLWMFLVDEDDKVEWKLKVDALDDVADYRSQPVEALSTGTKTLYAFANLDAYVDAGSNLHNSSLSALLALEAGDVFNAGGIEIADPAASIDITGGSYIPMSGKAEVTVTENTTEIGVGMDRLVSKIRISLDRSAGESGTVTFGGTAGNVSLMKDGAVSSAGKAADRTVRFDGNTSGTVIPDFYVNATEAAGAGFTVRLDGTDASGNKVTYNAVTQRTLLPRNSIYPLNLNFPAFGFTMRAQAWLAPIGAFVPVVDEDVEGRFTVDLPQGCTFTFALSGSGMDNLLAEWPAVGDYGSYGITESGNGSVSGVLSTAAAVGSRIEITCHVEFTASVDGKASTYSRTYTLIINVRDIWDFPLTEQPAQILPSETLDMYKNQKK